MGKHFEKLMNLRVGKCIWDVAGPKGVIIPWGHASAGLNISPECAWDRLGSFKWRKKTNSPMSPKTSRKWIYERKHQDKEEDCILQVFHARVVSSSSEDLSDPLLRAATKPRRAVPRPCGSDKRQKQPSLTQVLSPSSSTTRHTETASSFQPSPFSADFELQISLLYLESPNSLQEFALSFIILLVYVLDWAATTKGQAERLKQRTLISHSYRGWEAWGQGTSMVWFWWGSFLVADYQRPCAPSHGGKDSWGTLWSLLIRASIHPMTCYFSKTPLTKTMALGLGVHICILEGHKHSVHCSLRFSKKCIYFHFYLPCCVAKIMFAVQLVNWIYCCLQSNGLLTTVISVGDLELILKHFIS